MTVDVLGPDVIFATDDALVVVGTVDDDVDVYDLLDEKGGGYRGVVFITPINESGTSTGSSRCSIAIFVMLRGWSLISCSSILFCLLAHAVCDAGATVEEQVTDVIRPVVAGEGPAVGVTDEVFNS